MEKSDKIDKVRVKTLSFKKNEEDELFEFMNIQSNLSDTLIYLMQKEIAEYGIRNLQMYVPAIRNIESVRNFISGTNKINSINISNAGVNSEVKEDKVKKTDSEEDIPEELL